MLRWLFALSMLCLMPKPALAWGDQGHHLTCQIAYGLLTPAARQQVDHLLSTQQPRYRAFARACTYPDKVKEQDGRRAMHFVNLRRVDTRLDGVVCPVATTPGACLLAAIEDDYEVIRNQGAPDTERATALMYLGHWLGDLHQPLHISFKDDAGGNAINTTGLCTYGGGISNLHSIWDSCIIVQRIFANSARRDMVDDPRFYLASDRLRVTVSATMAQQWRSGAPWSWANESYAIARTASTRYCTMRSGSCWYYDQNQSPPDKKEPRSVEIDAAYVDAFAPVVRERLQRGGVRLAHILNQALDPNYA